MKKTGSFFNKLLTFLAIAWLATLGLESYNAKKLAKDLVTTAPDISLCYDYNLRLNDQQKTLYSETVAQLQKGKIKVKSDLIKELPIEYVEETMKAVLGDHPEFFWLMNNYKISAFYKTVTFDPYNYLGITISAEKYSQSFADSIEEISNQVEEINSDTDKVKYVHDYLVRKVSYNHKAADESWYDIAYNYNSEYAFAGSAYGALVNSSAVCAGYAKAFQTVLQNNGICCGYVTGEVSEGHHAWSVVNVNGRDYYFDVTWDDLGDYREYPNDLVYTYYALDKAEMDKDHHADEFYQNLIY